jgi:hypothetical protein
LSAAFFKVFDQQHATFVPTIFCPTKPTQIAYNRSRYEMLKTGRLLLGAVNVLGFIQC